jgi:hypothetical protein
MKKKNRSKHKKIRGEITFCISVMDYEIDYMFALPVRDDFVPGPYWEHSRMKLVGTIIDPENFRGRELVVDLLGSRSSVQALERPHESRLEPICVGTLKLRGRESSFLGSIPFDAFHLLYQLMKDKKIEYVMLAGPELYRGTSEIRSIYFEKDYVQEDWGRKQNDNSAGHDSKVQE